MDYDEPRGCFMNWVLHPALRLSFWIALAFALAIPGCGPGRGDLSGRVTYQGKPVSSGSVVIRGADKMLRSSPIAADAAYAVKDIGAGLVTITVYCPDPAAVATISRQPGKPAPLKDNSKWFPIPAHYKDFDKSGLTFQLKSGPNQWDIDLK
jgi:hypothetical protein